MIRALIVLHVGSGVVWLVASAIALVRHFDGLWILLLQAVAASATLFAGIGLWHALHAHGMGAAEHMLVLGTFCSLLALGLQAGVGLSGERGRRSATGLGLQAAGVALVSAAAFAMVASRFVS